MKEMTSAEFAKANLAALAEPVSVRRYTKHLGTYYPEGYTPAKPPDLGLTWSEDRETDKLRIAELEEEVKRLRRELAARPPATPTGNEEFVAQSRRTIQPKDIDLDTPLGKR